ncbi:MAG: hypothetical protein QOH70_1972 [Blastocatellia bacterium]|jgi:hypothetical protein|nr:hypothetical protein [Blastocatellia bacterium]
MILRCLYKEYELTFVLDASSQVRTPWIHSDFCLLEDDFSPISRLFESFYSLGFRLIFDGSSDGRRGRRQATSVGCQETEYS